MAFVLGALLVAAAVVLFLLQPFLKGLSASLERTGDEMTETEARKRVALLALRDVEYDYLAGKLDDADYHAMKGRLTAEALAAMEADEADHRRQDSGAAGTPEVEARIARARAMLRATPAECASCGFRNPEGSRFCSACGAPVVSQAAG